jgi:hypothetical protein
MRENITIKKTNGTKINMLLELDRLFINVQMNINVNSVVKVEEIGYRNVSLLVRFEAGKKKESLF